MTKEQITFLQLDHELLPLKEVLSKTIVDEDGNLTSLQLNWNTKIVYLYMLDRFSFFKSLGKVYFDNQDDVAKMLCLSRKTVVEIIGALAKVGLITVTKKKLQGATFSNNYVVFDIFDKNKFIADAKRSKSATSDKYVKKKQKVEKVVEPPKKQPIFIHYEEETPF